MDNKNVLLDSLIIENERLRNQLNTAKEELENSKNLKAYYHVLSQLKNSEIDDYKEIVKDLESRMEDSLTILYKLQEELKKNNNDVNELIVSNVIALLKIDED